MIKKFYRNIASFLAMVSMVGQSLNPWLALPIILQPAFAQEESIQETQDPNVTPAEEPSPAPEPTTEPSPEPTASPDPSEASEPSPSPVVESTPEPSTEPTPEITPTPEPDPETDSLSETTSPNETVPQEAEPTDSPENSSSQDVPMIEVVAESSDEGKLAVVVIPSAEEVPSFAFASPEALESAALTTDKSDYVPTDTVAITGTDFTPTQTYTLVITSEYEPAVHLETQVQADENGTFVYLYQLDGNYRPLYHIDAINQEGTVVASITFTDSPPSGCYNDSAGANDEPNQKDLTKACTDYAGLPSNSAVDWNWDEINGSGSNTYDACSLYDTNNDGFANYSVCVTLEGIPLSQVADSPRIYSCNDTRADRCAGSTLVSGPYTTSCTVGQDDSDPFPTGDVYPQDTEASCTVAMGEVGGAVSALLDVCSYPSAQPNSDPSDCIFASTASQTGKLEVVKNLTPSTDDGKFNLQIDSTTYASDVGNGGTTGEKIVSTGNHTVGETAGTDTSLSDYSSSIICKDNNGAGSTIASASHSGPLTVNIVNNADIVCTISNTIQPGYLTVLKHVINDNGGTAVAGDFTMSVLGSNVSEPTFPGDDSGTTVTLDAGSYSVSESGPDGYSQEYSLDCSGTIAPGERKTCTVDNDDIQPKLTVTKNIITDDGGAMTVVDFLLFVNDTQVQSGEPNGFDAGSYVVSETQHPGYTSQISGDCDEQGNVGLELGDDKSCTVTNDDIAPTLTLVKEVITDNGGTATQADFQATIDDEPVPWDTPLTLQVGSYTASESEPGGYAASTWAGDCDEDGVVDLIEGENKTCTITNDDIAPTITLYKEVINDDGGTAGPDDFGISIGGIGVFSGSTTTVDANAPMAIDESGLTGYAFVTIVGDRNCPSQLGESVTLSEGENLTCTITNDDIPPTLTLEKTVVNDSGGTAQDTDWTLSATGTERSFASTTPASGTVMAAVVYTLSESGGPSGYIAGGWICDGGIQEGDQLTLGLAEEVTCTIENNDIQPLLTVTKVMITDNGGTKGVADFPLFVNDVQVTSGQANGFDAGTYLVSETQQPGYTSQISGDCDEQGNVMLEVGDEKSCTITNDDLPGSIAGKKWNDEDGNGELGEEPGLSNWHIQLIKDNDGEIGDQVGDDAVTDENGDYLFDGIDAGDYFVCEVLQEGWEQTFPVPPICHEVTVGSGEDLDGYHFGNQQLPTEFQISKSNNVSGPQGPSTTVIYTITVHNPNRRTVYNVLVTDLLSEGFSYLSGSWTANSDLRGDLRLAGITPEPTYASPGVWQLGNMPALETATLTYQAVISAAQFPGIYGDIAFAYGCQKDTDCLATDPGALLALAVDPGYIDTNVVGTQVEVGKEYQSGASYDVEHEERILGAATELPATGADTGWLMTAVVMLVGGLRLVKVGIKSRRKHG